MLVFKEKGNIFKQFKNDWRKERYIIQVITKHGNIYFSDSADELTKEDILDSWKNERHLYFHHNGK
jgi:hypothetical protein